MENNRKVTGIDINHYGGEFPPNYTESVLKQANRGLFKGFLALLLGAVSAVTDTIGIVFGLFLVSGGCLVTAVLVALMLTMLVAVLH